MVLAPFTASYSERSPYITLEEFKFSPTASSIDVTDLVDQGGQAAQDRALSDLIVRASNMVDVYVTGKSYGTIGASLNSESGRYYANREGQFVIKPNFTPIIALETFSYGPTPANQIPIPLSSDNASIEETEFIVSAWWGSNGTAWSGQNLGMLGGFSNRYKQFCNWTYVNGWANSFLASQVNAGVNSATLTNVVGIYPGMNLTLWDGMNTENVVIASNYAPGNTTVTFSSNLLYKHGTGCNISALPPVVKQAVIHFTVAMIKERGQAGVVLGENGFTEASGRGFDKESDMALGYDLLDEFKSVWGRS